MEYLPPIKQLHVVSETEIEVEGTRYSCRLGRGGIAAAHQKREGDLKTPSGSFPMRECFYRPDRITPSPFFTQLPLTSLMPSDGWCDDPSHPLYNQRIKRPFSANHEILWRTDHVYDVIIPLGYNDHPPVAGYGSAIFMHLMRPDGVGTEGCVALGREDLLQLLPRFSTETHVIIG